MKQFLHFSNKKNELFISKMSKQDVLTFFKLIFPNFVESDPFPQKLVLTNQHFWTKSHC